MVSRSTFLHHLNSVITMRGRSKLGRPYRWLSTADDEKGSFNMDSLNFEVIGEIWFLPDEPVDVMLPRKAAKELFRCPYRKPTQVDGMRILRRTCEISLRNSAN